MNSATPSNLPRRIQEGWQITSFTLQQEGSNLHPCRGHPVGGPASPGRGAAVVAVRRRAPRRPRKACAGSRRRPLVACSTHPKSGRSHRQRLQPAQRPACVHPPPHRSHRAPARTVAEHRARLARQPRGAGQLGLRESGRSAGAGRLGARPQAAEGQEAPPRSVKWPAWAWRGGRRGGHGSRRAAAMGTAGVGPAAGAIGAALGAAHRRLGRPWAPRGAREVGYLTLCAPPCPCAYSRAVPSSLSPWESYFACM